MNNAEKRAAVLRWEKTILEVDATLDEFISMVGVEGKIQGAFYTLKDEYTRAVSKRIGDVDEWLDWYELENGMGKSEGLVTGIKGVDRVKNIEDLLKILLGEENEI